MKWVCQSPVFLCILQPFLKDASSSHGPRNWIVTGSPTSSSCYLTIDFAGSSSFRCVGWPRSRCRCVAHRFLVPLNRWGKVARKIIRRSAGGRRRGSFLRRGWLTLLWGCWSSLLLRWRSHHLRRLRRSLLLWWQRRLLLPWRRTLRRRRWPTISLTNRW